MKKMLAILMVLGLSLAACGGDDGGSDDGDKDTTVAQDTGGGEDTTGWPDGGATQCPGLPDLTGRAFRIDVMHATSPTDQLDGVWDKDIANHDLVLVFRVVAHDTEAETMTCTITSASATVEGEGDDKVATAYNYALEPSEFQVKFEGCRFVIEDPIELDIITPTVNKPFHIEGIIGHGDLNADGTRITQGYLKGGIMLEEAVDLCMTFPGMGVVNFHWFMNLAHLCPEWDMDGDGNIDSYFFEGHFEASQTDLFEDGIIPMDPVAEECKPHTDECTPVD